MKRKNCNTTLQRLLLAVLVLVMCLAGSMIAAAATGWREEDGNWVYYDEDGTMLTDAWCKSGAHWFYLGPDGIMVKGELVEYNDSLYFTDPETGAMVQSAWWNIDGYHYYFNPAGKALMDCTKMIDGVKYTFDEEGRLVGGNATPSNATVKRVLEELKYSVQQAEANDLDDCMAYVEYYASNKLLDAIPVPDDCSILIEASPSNCKPAVAGTMSDKNGTDGKFTFYLIFTIQTGYEGDEASVTTKLLTMNIIATPYTGSGSSGSSNSSSSSGSSGRISTASVEQLYLQEVAKNYTVSGTWETADGKWKLKKSDGTYLANAWAYLDEKWYYMGEDAYMKAGLTTIGDQVFYLDPVTGEMKTGWLLLDGKWYYFSTDKQGSQGAMYKDTTTPDGYKVGPDGAWIE